MTSAVFIPHATPTLAFISLISLRPTPDYDVKQGRAAAAVSICMQHDAENSLYFVATQG